MSKWYKYEVNENTDIREITADVAAREKVSNDSSTNSKLPHESKISDNKKNYKEETLTYDMCREGYVPAKRTEIVDLYPITPDQYYKLSFFKGEERRKVEQQICEDNNKPFLNEDEEILNIYPNGKGDTNFCRRVRRVEEEEKLPPHGTFYLTLDDKGPILKTLDLSMDEYISVKSTDIREHINTFVKYRENYEKEGFKHSERILLHGPPGNGKTMEILNAINHSKKDGIISIFIPSSVDLHFIHDFRKALEGENVIFVIEELAERTKDNDDVEEVLSFLDGENSWDNSFVISTTNYPDVLPPNIADRPGRFNKIIEFKAPTLKEKQNYLIGKGIDSDVAERVAKESEGMSLDHLAYAVKQYKIFGTNPVDVIKESKEMRKKVQAIFNKRERAGI